MSIKTFDESGNELVRNEVSTVVRAGPVAGAAIAVPPSRATCRCRAPDAVVEEKTRDNQGAALSLVGRHQPAARRPCFAQGSASTSPSCTACAPMALPARAVIARL